MSDGLLLVDSDIFVVLAAAGRLETTAELLGFEMPRLRRLDALPHMLERGKKFKDFTTDQRTAALNLAKTVTPLTDRPNDDAVLQQLVGAVDPGEALLLSLVCEQPLTWLTSGDVRAMKAVCGTADLSNVKSAVGGRILCLEAAIFRLIQHDGHEETAAAFKDVRPANKTLRCLFPDDPTPQDQLAATQSYLRHLCQSLGIGFLHCPPCPNAKATGVCLLVPPSG